MLHSDWDTEFTKIMSGGGMIVPLYLNFDLTR